MAAPATSASSTSTQVTSVRCLWLVLRSLPLVVRGLLLGRLVLGLPVRVADELLPPTPAEGPDEQDDRKNDVPRRRDELLRDGIGRGVRRAGDAVQRRDVEGLRDPGAAWSHGGDIRDRVAAADSHQGVKRHGDVVCSEEDTHDGQACYPGDERGKEDPAKVRPRVREDRAALLRAFPPAKY